MSDDKFLTVAKKAALEAGKTILKYYGQNHRLIIKTDNSDFVTQADLAAEKIIVDIIKKNFPDHNIISEEKVKLDKKSNYTWAVDPVDGTLSFASKMPFFSVSIGLLKDNQPILGVIYHVSQKDLYWAQKGQGAFLNGQKISVSKTEKLENAVMALGLGTITRRKAKLENYFFPLLDKVRYVYILGGGAVSMAFLAKGSLDAYPNKAWIWDQAAAAVIITEAGGKISDRLGKPVDWTAEYTEFIASNGLLHQQLLEAINK